MKDFNQFDSTALLFGLLQQASVFCYHSSLEGRDFKARKIRETS